MPYKDPADQRAACRRHYEANKPAYFKRSKRQKEVARVRNRGFIRTYLAVHPCVDCGESDPIVLEFGHVRGVKLYDVATMVQRHTSLRTIAAEIAKCDIRCANCHRRKTYFERRGVEQFGSSAVS